jgi:hypothetical protein
MFAPRDESSIAMAAPMPVEEPEINAVLPCIFSFFVLGSLCENWYEIFGVALDDYCKGSIDALLMGRSRLTTGRRRPETLGVMN